MIAFVLDHHHGDDGTLSVGMLPDLDRTRFAELEKQGLVREATPEEIEAGYKPEFFADALGEKDSFTFTFGVDSAAVQELLAAAEEGINAAVLRADTAEKPLLEERELGNQLAIDLSTVTDELAGARKDLEALKEAGLITDKALTEARAEVETLKTAASAKEAVPPLNKDGPKPSNKAN